MRDLALALKVDQCGESSLLRSIFNLLLECLVIALALLTVQFIVLYKLTILNNHLDEPFFSIAILIFFLVQLG